MGRPEPRSFQTSPQCGPCCKPPPGQPPAVKKPAFSSSTACVCGPMPTIAKGVERRVVPRGYASIAVPDVLDSSLYIIDAFARSNSPPGLWPACSWVHALQQPSEFCREKEDQNPPDAYMAVARFGTRSRGRGTNERSSRTCSR